ncbi:MAG: zf-HC2 domain-containing protein [Acidimicrobiales bacterium]
MMRLMMRLRRKAGISCARVQDLVQAYLDGELEGRDRDRLAAHLDRCRPCGVEAATYERITASLAAPVPLEVVERLSRFAASISNDPSDD